MIVVMSSQATAEQIEQAVERLESMGFGVHRSTGENHTILGAIGKPREEDRTVMEMMPGVERAVLVSQPFKLVSREFKKENSVIEVGGHIRIGEDKLAVIAGPCAVEDEESLIQVAIEAKKAGASMLRGGAFKPRTSPYSFQGLEKEGLEILARAREISGLPVVTEVLDQYSVELVASYADVLQIGARNMQNFRLLREVGRVDKPVLLKRGMSATMEEWLMAAEYILSEGNHRVILCERGIRTFETYTRNTLDLSALPVIKHLSHLPVIVDPSHGTGNWRWVPAMSKAAVAAGSDGLMLEVHPAPQQALSDGAQSLTPDKFARLMTELGSVAESVGRGL